MNDLLGLIAELAVGFTGFAAIARVHVGRARRADVSHLKGYSRAASVLIYLIAAVGAAGLILALAVPAVSSAAAYVGALFLWVVMLGVYFVRIASSLLTHRLADGE